jgi:benzodiazapine receptor
MAALFIAAAQTAGLIGIPFTTVGPWYNNLEKAPFNPPSWVFGPVWTLLYVMIGYAGWRAWLAEPSRSRTLALRGWWTQLALNASWTPVFFGLQQPEAGLVVLLLVVVAVTATWWHLRKAASMAGVLFVPYLGWVLFATALNAWIVFAN